MMERLFTFFSSYAADEKLAALMATTAAALLAILLITVVELGVKRVLLQLISKVAARTSTRFDDLLVGHKVFEGLARLLPPILVQLLSTPVLFYYPDYVPIVQDFAVIYFTIMLVAVLLSSFDAFYEFVCRFPEASRLPLKSFIQVLKSIVVSLGLIVVVSKLLGKSPIVFLSGLGAFTAVLLLVFKDSILGLVAGIQLSSNNLVRVGDWIEMPKYGADGDVIDISLVTVSVQNWDKTISTIPAYALISEGFKNWRGMSESGGRRIKRSINIDMQSVRFCDEEMLQQLRQVQVLREYLASREQEVAEWNRSHQIEGSSPANGRRLTNFGTFRAYVVAYLRQHPSVNQSMTFLVRHLQPTAEGIPLELYIFSKETAWPVYEGVQADIMDHLLAVMPLFGLRVFQSPAGSDIAAVGSALKEALTASASAAR